METEFEHFDLVENRPVSNFGEQPKLKIAMFTDVFLDVPGGIPSSIMAQHDALTEQGHIVKVFAPGSVASIEQMPESIRPDIVLVPTNKSIKMNGAPLAKRPKLIKKAVLKQFPGFNAQFDLIHVHYEGACSVAGVQLARHFDLPLVQTMHGREDMAIAVNVPHPAKTIVACALNALHRHCLHKYIGLAYSNHEQKYRGGINEQKLNVRTDKVVRLNEVQETKVHRDKYLAPTIARAKMWTLMVREANCADVVITPSQHFADKLKHYGVKRALVPVSNGVDDHTAEVFNWQIRELHEGEPVKIAWYSRLSREKRVMEFLEALKIVNDRGGKFQLLMMGDGNQLELAKKYAAVNGFANSVTFLGAVPHDQVLEKLQDQHLSIINSYGFDTQGLTILEAAVTGVPVIYCDPDMDQVVLPGGGMRAKDYSPESMAEVILNILQYPESIREMSDAQMRQRHQNLQSTQIKKLLEVYNSVLA